MMGREKGKPKITPFKIMSPFFDPRKIGPAPNVTERIAPLRLKVVTDAFTVGASAISLVPSAIWKPNNVTYGTWI